MKKNIYKKFLIVLLIISICFSQSACWSMRELDTLSFVLAAGIDRTEEGEILLTVQIARPAAFAGEEAKVPNFQDNNVWVVSAKGETVLDASRELEKKVPRSLYWGHTIMLVIGEEMAKHDMLLAIDFLTRSTVIRETMWVLTTKSSASEVLNSHSQLESTSAQAVDQMLRLGIGLQVTLLEVMILLASDINPLLPVVELTPAGVPQGPGLLENIPEAEKEGHEPDVPIHAEVTISGSAVYKDNKLVGWLDSKETRGALWLKDKMEMGGFVTIPSLTDPDKKLTILIAGASTKVEPYYDGQNIWFNVRIEAEGDIMEQQSAEDLSEPEIMDAYDRVMEQKIEERIQMVLEKAQQEYQVDMFHFGPIFYRKYPTKWAEIKDHWNEEFANVQVNIAVEANLRRTGLQVRNE